MPDTVNHVLTRSLERRFQRIRDYIYTLRLAVSLHSHRRLVIVTTDCPVRPLENKAALGLRLMFPGIAERTPPRFKFRKPAAVPGDGDAVLVDLQTVGEIRHRGDFDRFSSPRWNQVPNVVPYPR